MGLQAHASVTERPRVQPRPSYQRLHHRTAEPAAAASQFQGTPRQQMMPIARHALWTGSRGGLATSMDFVSAPTESVAREWTMTCTEASSFLLFESIFNTDAHPAPSSSNDGSGRSLSCSGGCNAIPSPPWLHRQPVCIRALQRP